MDIQEMIRLMRKGYSNRKIAEALQLNRKTVDKYRQLAEQTGRLEGELPELAVLEAELEALLPEKQPPQNISSVEPYRAFVEKLHKKGVETAAIRQRLIDDHGYTGSYASVWRFVNRLESPKEEEAMTRMEVKPGEEAQVDFGYAGKMIDPHSGELRKAWGFVMTLSHSRHQFVVFVFDQRVATWLLCHRKAFEFFGGVPERVVIDNLKAAILRACWNDPQTQRAYRECALHYGFLIAPCKAGKPQHKGKVEQGGVHYVSRNFLAGQETLQLDEANRGVLGWCLNVAGLRDHGTTHKQPLRQFEQVESAALQPLPETPYEPGEWKQVKLHRDCHVVFNRSYYSAPHRLIGEQLWVRGGLTDVRIYTEKHELVAVHSKAREAGERKTELVHLPAEKVPGMLLSRPWCQQQADLIGPAASEVVQRLLAHRPEDRMRSAGRLLGLVEEYGAARVEQACLRSLSFGEANYVTVKRILTQGLDRQEVMIHETPPPASRFVRSAQAFARQLLGGESWT